MKLKKPMRKEKMDKKTERGFIIDYARNLYLAKSSDGKNKYSLMKITEKINKKFNVKYSKQRICQWAKKYAWKQLDENIKDFAVAKIKNLDEAELNRAISVIKSSERSEYLSIWKAVLKSLSKEFFRRVSNDEIKNISSRDLITGMEKSFNALANHLGLENEKTIIHKTIDENGNITGLDMSRMSEDELKKLVE